METITWRATPLARGSGYLGVSVGVAGIVGALVDGFANGDAADAAPLGVMALAFGFACWRFSLFPSVAATADGLVVQNPLRTHHIAWRDVSRVESGYSGLAIITPRGVIGAWAVQKSNLATWTHRETRSDAIAKQISAFAASV
jgi:hypothetical protein